MYWTTPSGTRYQIGSARPTRCAAVGRADRHGRDLLQRHAVLRQARVGQLVARPRDADEVRQLEQLVGVLPRQDLGQRVGAGDEEQLVVGPLRVQVAQRVDGVGDALPVDVDPADGEAGVGGGRDDRHEVAVLGGADAVLVPGLAGRHEDDLVEPEERLHLTGGDEVAVVDRVEGATHDAEAHTSAAIARPRVRVRAGHLLRGAAERPQHQPAGARSRRGRARRTCTGTWAARARAPRQRRERWPETTTCGTAYPSRARAPAITRPTERGMPWRPGSPHRAPALPPAHEPLGGLGVVHDFCAQGCAQPAAGAHTRCGQTCGQRRRLKRFQRNRCGEPRPATRTVPTRSTRRPRPGRPGVCRRAEQGPVG